MQLLALLSILDSICLKLQLATKITNSSNSKTISNNSRIHKTLTHSLLAPTQTRMLNKTTREGWHLINLSSTSFKR